MPRLLNAQTVETIKAAATRYPTKLAALLPALHAAQDQLGAIPKEAQLDIAEILDVPPTRVHEVVTFYTMFYEESPGKHIVKICRNLACELRGAGAIIHKAEAVLGVKCGETTPDGKVRLEHEECLASCGTGPMLLHCQRGSHDLRLVENLTEEKLEGFLKGLS